MHYGHSITVKAYSVMAVTLEQALLYTICPKIGDCSFKAQARARAGFVPLWLGKTYLCAYWPGMGNLPVTGAPAINLSRTCPVLFSSNDLHSLLYHRQRSDSDSRLPKACHCFSLRTWNMRGWRPLCGNITMEIVSQLLHSGHCRDPPR